MLFAHGTNHSRGVLILFNSELQFEIKKVLNDNGGRYIFVEVTIQDSPFLLVNLYAPTNIGGSNVVFSKALCLY